MNQAPDTPMTPARELTAIKHDIIKELFLKTDDQTYVVARWCFLNRLYLDFYWNAVHALEKYLKAVSLMNGRSAKAPIDGPPFGHDIVRLFEQVSELAATLLAKTSPEAAWRSQFTAQRIWTSGRIYASRPLFTVQQMT